MKEEGRKKGQKTPLLTDSTPSNTSLKALHPNTKSDKFSLGIAKTSRTKFGHLYSRQVPKPTVSISLTSLNVYNQPGRSRREKDMGKD